ncbi:PREDICTED: nuclear RNA export factor 2-like [Dufourea novaeangliae]|uniref:Nuclear RNA export factor 2 n=1 Tax=Dufourea novaeangliae TaxID=178035 RepID=A0A154PHV9_DUFNO|nr:PREDICTED: nuclear RNA export factor 2-like [Dufourea novaeangliae]KZC11413.1 Nuclear RNA export factor 2 [Dufourea novaeangliae]
MQRTKLPIVSMQLDSSIAIKMNLGGSLFQERTLMSRSDVWHKIRILKGTHYDKETVLKAILNAIEPAELVPVKYQALREDTYFLARNCAHALDKLCKTNLIIKNPEGDPLILIVTLGFASIHDLKINLQPLLLAALTKKYDPNKKSLNLEQFHKDPDMSKTVYCPLSQQRTFNHVLKLIKTALTTVEYLNLQKNELFNLSPVETSSLISIKYLDLRHNNLYNMDTLTPLKNLCILKLWLDGNPLCENYAKPNQYIESVKKYCPHLIQLDGVYVNTSGLPLTYTSCLKETREELVGKFVSHFFCLYDQADRTVLRGLYHKNAFYSMSLGILPAIACKRNLSQFTACRNLTRKPVDPNKKRQHLYYGQDNILGGLKRLPRSCHDRNTFVCDLMYDDGTYLAISVGGLFKTVNNASQVLYFNRTFVLLAGNDNEYNILNDQYFVDSTVEKIPVSKIESKIMYEEIVPTCFSLIEQEELVKKCVDATTLNEEWCRTYLEEAMWNIRKAISNFMKDYKSSAVPSDAFKR